MRLCRRNAGLSQERLAEFAGLDRNYIGKLEREESSPTLDTLEAVAAALQINVEKLIGRTLPAEARKKSQD